uniref:hypothetical protein n=1 Tax=uncultured Thiodictyon sp. TaxID=1846217 RepID=UPI0025D32582
MKIQSVKRIGTAGLLLVALASPSAGAATGFFVAKVIGVLIDSVNFGGCMAYLSTDPQTQLPGCGANWVSFSCTGDFNDTIRAYRMLDQAQLALATQKNAGFSIDDTKLHN